MDDNGKIFKGAKKREVAVTMAFARISNKLLHNKKIGKLMVPIIPEIKFN